MTITLQDIFNAAWQKFIVEDAPPAVEFVDNDICKYECRYLTSDGRKCAIGLVIPDGHKIQLSEKTFNIIVEKYPELWAEDVHNCNAGMLQRSLHDFMVDSSKGTWVCNKRVREKEYRKVAEALGLTIPGE